jgi:cytoskeletal protein CcmA (bactofilin family)
MDLLRLIARRFATALGVLAMLLAVAPTPALAFDLRSGESTVVDEGTTVNDDLYAFGNAIDIRGTVNGDVISGGRSVTISGTVNGDVIAAGGRVAVPGQVRGSVRAAGGNLEITGAVGEDVLVGGGTLAIDPTARIGRDLLFGGGTLTLDGQVARGARIGAGNATIGGRIEGDVRADVSELTVADTAAIDGDLVYSADQSATIAQGATIGGRTQRLATPEPTAPGMTDRVISAVVGWLQALVAMLLVGLIFVLLFPTFGRRSANAIWTAPWPSVGIGVALVLGVPMLAVLVLVIGIFIGGWWLAPIILGVYAAALVLGYAVSALLVGQSLAVQVGQRGWHLAAHQAVGLIVLLLAGAAPFVGWIVSLAAAVVGLGALALTMWRARRGEPTLAPA